jgi:tight adherence protein B
MSGMLDPTTMAALAVGLMTGVGFLLVAAGAEGAGSRRFTRRLDQLKARRLNAGQAATAAGMPSLSRTTSTMDRMVQRWLPRLDVLKARLQRTGRNIGIGKYVIATAVVMGILLFTALFIGRFKFMPSLMFAIALGVGIPHWVIGRMGRKRIAAFVKLFPEAIDLMVRALRSGLPISDAIINAGQEISDPVGTELGTVESGMRLGRELDELLWDIAKRIDVSEFRFFIIALSVQRETGGNLAETLSNLSDVLRKRRTMRAKARAMASEARASTAILGSLPVVVSILLLLTSPAYIMILFTDVRGLFLLGVAATMLGLGVLIMTKMAKFQI